MKFSRKLLYNVLPLRQTQKRCIYSIIVTLSDSRFQYSASSSASVKRVCALAFPQNADAMHRPSDSETDGNCKNAAERSLQFPRFAERTRMQCTASRTARVQIFSHAPFSGIQKDAASLQRPSIRKTMDFSFIARRQTSEARSVPLVREHRSTCSQQCCGRKRRVILSEELASVDQGSRPYGNAVKSLENLTR